MTYEAMLLFGLLFVADWLFSTLFQQRHALHLRGAGQIWLFLVLGLYFSWLWSHGGQTLAMKTWRIRMLTRQGLPLTFARAAYRYLLAWMWFLPGLATAWLMGAQAWMLILIPALNIAIWALTAYLDPQRQFLHDRIAGTQLVQIPTGQAVRTCKKA